MQRRPQEVGQGGPELAAVIPCVAGSAGRSAPIDPGSDAISKSSACSLRLCSSAALSGRFSAFYPRHIPGNFRTAQVEWRWEHGAIYTLKYLEMLSFPQSSHDSLTSYQADLLASYCHTCLDDRYHGRSVV